MTTKATILGLMMLTIAGCGKGGAPKTPLHAVRAKVFYYQAPAERALVVFHPVQPADENAPRPAGRVNAAGEVVFGTYQGVDGVPAGEYVATVTWQRRAITDADGGDEDEGDFFRGRYAHPNRSRFKVRVEPGSTELPPIVLR